MPKTKKAAPAAKKENAVPVKKAKATSTVNDLMQGISPGHRKNGK